MPKYRDRVYVVYFFDDKNDLVNDRVYRHRTLKAVKAALRSQGFKEDEYGVMRRRSLGFDVTQQGVQGQKPYRKKVVARLVTSVIYNGGVNNVKTEHAEIYEFTVPRQVG